MQTENHQRPPTGVAGLMGPIKSCPSFSLVLPRSPSFTEPAVGTGRLKPPSARNFLRFLAELPSQDPVMTSSHGPRWSAVNGYDLRWTIGFSLLSVMRCHGLAYKAAWVATTNGPPFACHECAHRETPAKWARCSEISVLDVGERHIDTGRPNGPCVRKNSRFFAGHNDGPCLARLRMNADDC